MYKLSNTSKMPGKSFSTPATMCNVGSNLCKVKGSVCSVCYARKGMYRFPSAQNLRQTNYDRYIGDPDSFKSELMTLIQAEYLNTGTPYFRWFDSGDLISERMLIDIIDIAREMPHMVFWLPTKEYAKLDHVTKSMEKMNITMPCNISIRLSVYMINGEYTKLPSHMSRITQTRVITADTTPVKDEYVCTLNCVGCNYTCWDNAKKVAYVQH